ncbi:helix-turn-helix domain-containing protein [Lysinibacillus sp. NPDC093712]|uniref:helix-turn-helix domain-containing protein n=1 Tax=Lysinibacillus sp. NPDC093712 TaxID=3390579 RepID=UPI003D070F11
MIKLTIDKAANSKGVSSQKELKELVLEKTGVELRSATISDLYRNNKNQINREHLFVIMEALEITDFNEVLTIKRR